MMMESIEEVSDSKGPSCQMDEGPTTTSNAADPGNSQLAIVLYLLDNNSNKDMDNDATKTDGNKNTLHAPSAPTK
jgi:hypothetical protein